MARQGLSPMAHQPPRYLHPAYSPHAAHLQHHTSKNIVGYYPIYRIPIAPYPTYRIDSVISDTVSEYPISLVSDISDSK